MPISNEEDKGVIEVVKGWPADDSYCIFQHILQNIDSIENFERRVGGKFHVDVDSGNKTNKPFLVSIGFVFYRDPQLKQKNNLKWRCIHHIFINMMQRDYRSLKHQLDSLIPMLNQDYSNHLTDGQCELLLLDACFVVCFVILHLEEGYPRLKEVSSKITSFINLIFIKYHVILF